VDYWNVFSKIARLVKSRNAAIIQTHCEKNNQIVQGKKLVRL
jgi:hypothetical protein